MSKRKSLMLWPALCLLAAFEAGAQQPQSAGGERLAGKAALGYLATSGNTESTSTNAAFSLTYRLTQWQHAFDISAVAASTNEVTTAEAYLFEHEARRGFGEHHFLFTSVDWKRDRFSGYAEQVSETVGYGRRLIDRGAHQLNGGLGAGLRQSELRDGTEEDDGIVRGSIDYVWSMTETTSFTQSVVVENGATNTMVESRSALHARIIGDISLVLSLRVKQNSAVPAGSANVDRFSSIALEYAF